MRCDATRFLLFYFTFFVLIVVTNQFKDTYILLAIVLLLFLLQRLQLPWP